MTSRAFLQIHGLALHAKRRHQAEEDSGLNLCVWLVGRGGCVLDNLVCRHHCRRPGRIQQTAPKVPTYLWPRINTKKSTTITNYHLKIAFKQQHNCLTHWTSPSPTHSGTQYTLWIMHMYSLSTGDHCRKVMTSKDWELLLTHFGLSMATFDTIRNKYSNPLEDLVWGWGCGVGVQSFKHTCSYFVHIVSLFPLHFWQILTLVVLVLSWATTYHMNQVAEITIPQLYSVPCSMAWPRTFWSFQNKLIWKFRNSAHPAIFWYTKSVLSERSNFMSKTNWNALTDLAF